MKIKNTIQILASLCALSMLPACMPQDFENFLWGEERMCDESDYVSAKVVNRTANPVYIRVCSPDSRYKANLETVPADGEFHEYSQLVDFKMNSYRMSAAEDCGTKSLTPNYSYNSYVALSAGDRTLFKLCRGEYKTISIIPTASTCPSGTEEYDQDSNPC